MSLSIRKAKTTILRGLVLLLGLALPLPALAVDGQTKFMAPAPRPTDSQPATFLDPNYTACGQECLHQRGKENLILQTVYNLFKVQKLETASTDVIFKSLAGFCEVPSSTDTTVRDNAATACRDRYRELQILLIYRLRAAIVHSNDQVARLNSDQDAEYSAAPRTFAPQEAQGSTPKKAHFPFLPTIQDLARTYKQLPPDGQAQLMGQLQVWSKDMVQGAPKDAFLSFKPTKKSASNPNDPGGYEIERDANGPKYDKAAMAAAQKIYGTKEKQAKLAADIAEYTRLRMKYKRTDYEAMQGEMPADQLSRDAFLEARGLIVQQIEGDLTGKPKAAAKGVALSASRTPAQGAAAAANGKPAPQPTYAPGPTMAAGTRILEDKRKDARPGDFSLTFDPSQIDCQLYRLQGLTGSALPKNCQ